MAEEDGDGDRRESVASGVSLSSAARAVFSARTRRQKEEEEEGNAVASLVREQVSKDSFSMERNNEEEGGGGADSAKESSTDTGISSAPMDVLSEEGRAPPQPPQPLPPLTPAKGGTEMKIFIEKAPEEEEEEEEVSGPETPTPPPAFQVPRRSIGIRLGRNKVGAGDGDEDEDGGGQVANRSDLRSAQFWQKLSKPRGLRENASLGVSAGRRNSDERGKTAKGIRNMRKKVSIKSQGKKSNQEELALNTIDGNISKVEEITEAFIALYMGEGFRIIMRYRYDIDPRTLEITCVENPLADQETCSEGLERDMFKGLSILHIACAFNQDQVVSYFLRYGSAILNISTCSGQSLLHTCSWYGATSCAALLVNQGGSLLVENATKHHPLHLAATNGHLGCLKELIRAGAPLDFEDSAGDTPLHAATRAGHFDCAKELLLYDADANAANRDGATALHHAATPALVGLLMSFGADPSAEVKEAGQPEGKKSAFNLLLERVPEGCEEILTTYLRSNGKSKGAVDLELSFQYDLFLHEYERHRKRGEIGSLLKVIWMDRNEILKHPVCESFLHFKWQLVKRIFYFYLFLYCLFLGAFTGLVLMNFSPNVSAHLPGEERDAASSACFIASACCLCVLVFKHLVSMLFAFRTYYTRSMHNVAELAMLVVTVPFLVLYQLEREDRKTIHLAAVSVFAVWFNFTLLLSNLPAAGIYINMVVHISKDVAKFLSFYSSTLIAFGLCFHVLCHGGGDVGQFSDPVTSVLSTLSMMVGEIGYDVYFARDAVFHQGTTQFMFFVFLLLVPIIMMNLLIGLAISNITTQFQAAGVDRLRMTVLLIRSLNNLFNRIKTLCPCCLRDINMFTYLRNKQGLEDVEEEMLDPPPLRVFVYPNRTGGDVFVKSKEGGEMVRTTFSLPDWVVANSFKRLHLDSNPGAAQAAQAEASDRRQQEDRLLKLSAEMKAIKKDLQAIKADVQGVSYFTKNVDKSGVFSSDGVMVRQSL